jgi:ATP-binding cassette subfamily C (CFTR/MRP) protein 1
MQALFRLTELTDDTITVDGIDISTIGLDTLRRSIAAIPQEPLLFSGTIRENLDPEGTSSDVTLNDALNRCGLMEIEESERNDRLARFKLDAEVADEGKNFS